MNDQKTAFLTASFNLWKKVKITRVMRGVSNTAVSDEPSLYGCGEVGNAWCKVNENGR